MAANTLLAGVDSLAFSHRAWDGIKTRKPVIRHLMQLGVFRLGLPEDRDVGIGIFPEGEELPIGSLRLYLVS